MVHEGVWCFIVCVGFANPSVKPIPVDTYCSVYRQTVINRDELSEIMKLPRNIRDRIQGNDLYHLCRCKNPKAKACASISP
jgi:hypothetical protein